MHVELRNLLQSQGTFTRGRGSGPALVFVEPCHPQGINLYLLFSSKETKSNNFIKFDILCSAL